MFLARWLPIDSARWPWILKVARTGALAFGVLCVPPLSVWQVVATGGDTSTEVGACTIKGTVADSISGQPIAGANVQASVALRGRSSMTDVSGRFTLVGLHAGRNIVTVRSEGYAHKQRQVLLIPGQELRGLDFRLDTTPVVGGRVLDKKGTPVANIKVVARPVSYSLGRMGLGYGATTTNDLGEYRLTLMDAARTYISVEPRPLAIESPVSRPRSSRDGLEGDDDIRMREVTTYYPGSPTMSGATLIDIRGGEVREGVDFLLLQDKTACVYSSVAALPTGGAGAFRVNVDITEALPTNMSQIASGQIVAGRGFRVCGVPAGTFRLMASAMDSSNTAWYGSEVFTISGRSVEVPPLIMGRLEAVPGRVRIAESEDDDPLPAGIQVSLQQKDRIGGRILEEPRANVKPNGEFVVPAVTRDEYWLWVWGLGGRFYVKDARVRGQDIWRRPMWVGNGEIEVVLGADGGSISGRVFREDKEPSVDAGVLLAAEPMPEEVSPCDLQTTLTDQNGRFEFSAVAPGTYIVLASSGELTSWMGSPEWIRTNRPKATKVELSPNDARNITITEISTW